MAAHHKDAVTQLAELGLNIGKDIVHSGRGFELNRLVMMVPFLFAEKFPQKDVALLAIQTFKKTETPPGFRHVMFPNPLSMPPTLEYPKLAKV